MTINQSKKTGVATGFTLIEVLIAIVVIVIGCLGMLSLQGSAMRGSAEAGQQTVAVFLAESEIERLKSLGVEVLSNEAQANKDTPVVEVLDRFGHKYDKAKASSGLIYTRTVTYYPELPTSRSTQVEVEVAWNSGFRDRRVFYTAVVTAFSF